MSGDRPGGRFVTRAQRFCGCAVSQNRRPTGHAPHKEIRRRIMKRITIRIFTVLGALILFAGLVHVVLVVAHVSEPAATTVYGPTARRLWATFVALLALAGVVVGGLALARPAGRFGHAAGRLGAIAAGVIAAVSGGLVVVVADGGPGTGNGVVGGAAALVLGLAAMILGGVALARARRPA